MKLMALADEYAETHSSDDEVKEEEEKIEQERDIIRSAIKSESVSEWHARTGHVSKEKLMEANIKYRLRLDPLEIEKFYHRGCEICARANAKRKAIHRKGGEHPLMETIDVGMILYVDMFGPSSVYGRKPDRKLGKIPCPSIYGEYYGLVAVEGHSRLVKYCNLKKKSEATKQIILWIKEIEKETGRTIKFLHTDNANDFCNIELEEFLAGKGIQFTHPTTYHPEHNGVVERMIGKLKLTMRAVLTGSEAPIQLWNKAMEWSVWLHNSLPMKAIGYETPFKKYTNYVTEIGNDLRVWGCNAYVVKTGPRRSKFEPNAWGGFLVGWSKKYRAHEIMDQQGEIVFSNDIVCNEFSFTAIETFKKKLEKKLIKAKPPKELPEEALVDFELERREEEPESKSELEHDIQNEEQGIGEQPDDLMIEDTQVNKPSREEMIKEKVKKAIEELEARGPQRTRYGRKIKPTSLGEVMGAVRRITGKKDLDKILNNMPTPWFKQAPQSYKEAIKYEDHIEWEGAIKQEYDSLIKNNTWILVERKPNMKVLKGKWVLDYKLGEYNELLRRKARYVIKGYAQNYGIDYFETHSPVVKSKSIRIMLILTALFDLELKQIDFDTAFLNGYLEEEVYMEQPEGYEVGDPKKMVCKLVKSIYGLKQAARVWYKSIDELLVKLGWRSTLVDPCFYTKMSKTGNRMFMSLYVDDSGIAYKKCDEAEWESYKKQISQLYKIKDIGDMHWILNMKITRDRDNRTITLSQEAYIRAMLEKFKLSHAEAVDNPEMVKSLNIESTPLNEEEHETYRSLIGSLLYAAITTRIDIAHIVGQLSRYLARPTEQHLLAARHALKYLKGTARLGLKLGKIEKSSNEIDENWLNQVNNDSWMKSDADNQMDNVVSPSVAHNNISPSVASNVVSPSAAHNDSDLINQMTMKSSEANANWMETDVISPGVAHETVSPGVARNEFNETNVSWINNHQGMTSERSYDEKTNTIKLKVDVNDKVDIKMFVSTDKSERFRKSRKESDNENIVSGMSDANWGSDEVDRRSVTGIILKLFGSPVSWFSKRQATIALSTTEAEYMAVSATVQEALWFKMWMREVLNKNVQVPISCDNQGAIKLTLRESDSQRTKHIDIRHHFIRDHINKGDINMKWIATETMEADLLTKRLPTHRFKKLRDLLLVECD